MRILNTTRRIEHETEWIEFTELNGEKFETVYFPGKKVEILERVMNAKYSSITYFMQTIWS